MELDGIKMCDVLEFDDDDKKELAVHIIFTDEIQKNMKTNKNYLEEKLHSLQQYIYEKTNNENMVPCRFKIRESFPYAKSGKRDVAKIKQEKDGFIVINKTIEENKQKKLSR